ncbi:hypothetical protein BGP_6533 [Beggiatoa sp. PS]|nr:hypothetical protein BGP_6533 [Beggiatoa sp. PS]
MPAANNGSFGTNENTSFSDILPASDANGDTLNYIKVSNPSKGTISVNASTGVFFIRPMRMPMARIPLLTK